MGIVQVPQDTIVGTGREETSSTKSLPPVQGLSTENEEKASVPRLSSLVYVLSERSLDNKAAMATGHGC
jgi:hypothetical protein